MTKAANDRVSLSVSDFLPDGWANFGQGNTRCPRPFIGDSSGTNTVVPDDLSGIHQGGNVPPDCDSYSKSVGGDTPCDGRSWRPIASVCVLLPKIRRFNYASRSGIALCGRAVMFWSWAARNGSAYEYAPPSSVRARLKRKNAEGTTFGERVAL